MGGTDNDHLGGGGYIYSCLPPYNSNSNFLQFEIKPLVSRTLNLRDSLLGENASGQLGIVA